MDLNSLRRLNWLWKNRHTHDDDDTDTRITIIRERVERVEEGTGEAKSGAHIHLERSSTLSLTSGAQTAIPWTRYYATIGRQEFPALSFPATSVPVLKEGYYDVKVELALASAVDDALVEIVRVRDAVETVMFPFDSDPRVWEADYSTSVFVDVAKGIPCRGGDEIKVYVTQSSGSAVNLTSATLTVELVDRIIISGWELVFEAVNFGVTWDGSAWWTTDHLDDADPALFERDANGTALNSYSGFDTESPARNRAIVWDGSTWLYGVGNQTAVFRIDPSDGSSSNLFTVDGDGHTGIGWNGTNLFVVEHEATAEIFEHTVAGSKQNTFSHPTGHTVLDITWDGTQWWATTLDGLVISMDTSFNETLSMAGPGTDDYASGSVAAGVGGCHFRDGYLYVMTSAGLYRKAI